jgi:hypothetical protein
MSPQKRGNGDMPFGYSRQATLKRKQFEMTNSTLPAARQWQTKHISMAQ